MVLHKLYRYYFIAIAVSNKELKTAEAMFIEATQNLPPPDVIEKTNSISGISRTNG